MAYLQDGASFLHQQDSGRPAAGYKLNYIQHRYLRLSANLLLTKTFGRLTPRAPIDRAEMPDFIYEMIVVQVKLTLKLAFNVACSRYRRRSQLDIILLAMHHRGKAAFLRMFNDHRRQWFRMIAAHHKK